MVTEMCHFTTLSFQPYLFRLESAGLSAEVAPFGNSRIKHLLAAPLDLSQLATSFIVF